MPDAVRIEDATLAAGDAAGGILFGVELDKFGAIGGDIAEKADIMRFFHGMLHCDIIIPVTFLDMDVMCIIGFFGFKGWQGDAAAAECACADGLYDIAADRADIELHFSDIGGAVFVDSAFSGEQLRHGHAESGG